MLYRKEASSRNRKSNIVLGGEGSIVELRGKLALGTGTPSKAS